MTTAALVAHPGTQHAPKLSRELARRGLLASYWTGMGWRRESVIGMALSGMHRLPGVRGLSSRIFPGIPPGRLRIKPVNELRALWRLKRGAESQQVIFQRNEHFQLAIPEKALRNCSAVIGFDTSSWVLAERATQLDLRFWLERTIADPAMGTKQAAILQRDFPAWARDGTSRYPLLVEAESREHALAHRIVVGSNFAKDTLLSAGIESARVRVNPYGVDWDRFAGQARPARTNDKVKFLFVGSLQGRKGLPYLLAAWARLGKVNAELWLAGTAGSAEAAILPTLPGLRYLGQIPHREMPALFSQADVFVLPSLYEGFSLAVLEALASGLPIIATPNTGATDALEHPQLGLIIPSASVDALESALRQYVSSPPDHQQIRKKSLSLADRYSWASYGDRWANMLAEP